MACGIAPFMMTWSDLHGHSRIASLFKMCGKKTVTLFSYVISVIVRQLCYLTRFRLS